MILQNTNDDDDEYIGFSCRSPFFATYRDANGIWHRSSFADAPNWEYWHKFDVVSQSVILKKISH